MITNKMKNRKQYGLGTPEISVLRNYGLTALVYLLLAAMNACTFATNGKPVAKGLPPRSVLLVLDIQNDFTTTQGAMPVTRQDTLLENINQAVKTARERQIPVVYVGNEFNPYSPAGLFRNFAALKGTNGARLDDRLLKAGPYFSKDYPDAFSNSQLEQWMAEHNITRLYISGVFAGQCVLSTALGARNRGYRVTILRDAIASDSTESLQSAIAEYHHYRLQVMTVKDFSESNF